MASQRLRFVIDRLYKPVAIDTRLVFALSREDAKALPRLPSVAVISVTAPDRPQASLAGVEYLLRISFADFDFENPSVSARAQARLPDKFTSDHARKIGSFVESLPAAVRTIVVHCEGGFSRSCSCAIAMGLRELYGFTVEPEQLTEANPSVKKALIHTLKK